MSRLTQVAGLCLGCLLVSAPVHAQFGGPRPTVIENVRIHTGDGQLIENGSILIVGNRIRTVAEHARVPQRANRIDGAGMVATPGLIDVRSLLTISPGASGGNNPTATAVDEFDRYDARSIEDAIRQGVTTIYVSSTGHRGFGPAGSIIRLEPLGDGWDFIGYGQALQPSVALTLNFQSDADPINRLQLVDSIRSQLRTALEHEKALELYEELLEEYLKKLKEQADEADEEAGEGAGNREPQQRPAPAGRGGDGERTPPQQRPARRRPPTADGESGGNGDEVASDDVGTESLINSDATALQDPPRRRGQRPGPAPQRQQPARPQQRDTADDSDKPTPPPPNRRADEIIKALNHDLPVRVQADRAEDILNALEVAEEFGLKLILEGGTEAHLVADQLARAGVPVILTANSSLPNSDLPRRGAQLRHASDIASAMERAGVKWSFGSGSDSRHLLFSAQRLIQQSRLDIDPIELLTSQAARTLGIDDRHGRLAGGMNADIVLWTGDPLDPASRVARVLIGGRTVFELTDDLPDGE